MHESDALGTPTDNGIKANIELYLVAHATIHRTFIQCITVKWLQMICVSPLPPELTSSGNMMLPGGRDPRDLQEFVHSLEDSRRTCLLPYLPKSRISEKGEGNRGPPVLTGRHSQHEERLVDHRCVPFSVLLILSTPTLLSPLADLRDKLPFLYVTGEQGELIPEASDGARNSEWVALALGS